MLPAKFLVKLLYTLGLEGDDIELGARHLAFWDSLFETFGGRPKNLVEALRASGTLLGESDATQEEQLKFFGKLAALEETDRALMPLPTRPYEVESEDGAATELLVTTQPELSEFVADVVGVEDEQHDQDVSVQILNGNGVPGVGQAVASQLVGQGFNVVLTGNANRLDYPNTLLVVYDSTDGSVAAAEKAKRLLGTGQVQISEQEQDTVDLTIVVGKDFQRAQ